MSIAEKLQTIAENEQKVYDAGKRAEYDRFWDGYQNKGKRTHYATAFAGLGWDDTTFKPKYDIRPTDAYMMFRDSRISGDLVEICERQGITMDFSKALAIIYLFNNAINITRIGVLDFSSVSEASTTNDLFVNDSKLHTIDRIIVPNKVLNFNRAFDGCTSLKNLTIEGILNSAYLNFRACPFTRESITSIINALSTTTSALTVTFSRNAVNNAFTTDEWNALIATKSNWTISLV